MNIIIVGTKKCQTTKKAERFFKERNIKFYFKDLAQKNLSAGELENISRKFDLEDLIDRDGKQFKKRNLGYMKFDLEEELLNDSLLLKTPIVRNGSKVTLGYDLETWLDWIRNSE